MITSRIFIASAAMAMAVGNAALAEPLPTFGHYAATILVSSVTPSAEGVTCSSVAPAGTKVIGEYSLNTVGNVPVQIFRTVAADSQSVIRESFVNAPGNTKKNQSGMLTIAAFSVANGKQVVATLPYTAQLADYDPNSFGGTITVTFPGDSGGSCVQVNNAAFVRTSAD